METSSKYKNRDVVLVLVSTLIQRTYELVTSPAWSGQVSVVPAGVNSVPEHNYWREVVSDAGVVLNVVEPPRHIHVLLLLLDGQVNLGEKRNRLSR